MRKTSIPNVASICTDTHMGEGERKEEKKRGRGKRERDINVSSKPRGSSRALYPHTLKSLFEDPLTTNPESCDFLSPC